MLGRARREHWSELADVTVTGSRSGAHPGRLEAYSQGDGASFVPARPFDGRRARDRPRATLAKPGSAMPFAWCFTVAVRDNPGSASAAVGVGTNPRRAGSAAERIPELSLAPRPAPADVTVSPKAHERTGDLFLAPVLRASASTGR